MKRLVALTSLFFVVSACSGAKVDWHSPTVRTVRVTRSGDTYRFAMEGAHLQNVHSAALDCGDSPRTGTLSEQKNEVASMDFKASDLPAKFRCRMARLRLLDRSGEVEWVSVDNVYPDDGERN